MCWQFMPPERFLRCHSSYERHPLAKLGVEGVKPIAMNGIAECKTALTKLKFNKATENFFEGMACDDGCLNGPVCITHSPRNVVDVDKYGNEAKEKTIFNTVKLMTEF